MIPGGLVSYRRRPEARIIPSRPSNVRRSPCREFTNPTTSSRGTSTPTCWRRNARSLAAPGGSSRTGGCRLAAALHAEHRSGPRFGARRCRRPVRHLVAGSTPCGHARVIVGGTLQWAEPRGADRAAPGRDEDDGVSIRDLDGQTLTGDAPAPYRLPPSPATGYSPQHPATVSPALAKAFSERSGDIREPGRSRVPVPSG